MSHLDRREFLKYIAGGAIAAGLLKVNLSQLFGQVPPSGQDQPTSAPAAYLDKSLVIQVQSDRVFGFTDLNRRVLQEMISTGLSEMTGAASFSLAVKELFSKTDIIGFKFNSSHAGLLNTNVALAEEFFRLFKNYGFNPNRLLFIEVQPNDATLPPSGKVRFGWGREVDFGSGRDQLAAVLDQVTALVNVGTLKADAVSGMSGCLKNLAYGMIKHPARFFANACTPYIADIYNLPAIRNKVRFNMLSALRILLADEQLNSNNFLMEKNTLIFGRDVVAVDSVGFEILDTARKNKGLKPLIEGSDFPRQLLAANHKGLGVYHPDQIQVRTIKVG